MNKAQQFLSVAILAFAIIAVIHSKVSTDDVVMIVELTRHGARGPLNNVADTKWVLEYGKEQLTPVGRRQRYILGMNTRARYPSIFLKEEYDKFTPEFLAENMHVRSTNVNRTIESGFSHMSGIYNPAGANKSKLPYGQKLPFDDANSTQYKPPQKLLFEPQLNSSSPLPHAVASMPIHSVIDLQIDILQYSCPPLKKKQDEQIKDLIDDLNTEHYTAWIKQYEDIVQKATAFQGDIMPGVKGFMRCGKFGDFEIQNQMNSKTPYLDLTDPTHKKLYQGLTRCFEFMAAWYANVKSDAMLVTSSQNQVIMDEFSNWVKDSPNKRKYYQISAHDITLAPHLQLYGVQNLECIQKDINEGTFTESCPGMPVVASNIVWELIKKPSDKIEGQIKKRKKEKILSNFSESKADQFEVKISFNQKYIKFCPDSKEEDDYACDYSIFLKKLRSLTVDYTSYCGFELNPEEKSKSFSTLKAVLIGLNLFLTIMVGFLCVTACKAQRKYQKQIYESAE